MNKAQSNDNVWYYEVNGVRKGEISEANIAKLIETNILSNDSLVWKKGLSNWIEVQETELNIYIDDSIPPPITGKNINNSIVWTLAIAPILGYFLEAIIANVASGGNEYVASAKLASNSYWYITLLLNIGLSYYDEDVLKKAGHNTNKFKGITWLVPVYLYQRAQFLKQNYAYLIVWLVCFIFILSI